MPFDSIRRQYLKQILARRLTSIFPQPAPVDFFAARARLRAVSPRPSTDSLENIPADPATKVATASKKTNVVTRPSFDHAASSPALISPAKSEATSATARTSTTTLQTEAGQGKTDTAVTASTVSIGPADAHAAQLPPQTKGEHKYIGSRDIQAKLEALRRHTNPALLYQSQEEFMHGDISREEAERRLLQSGMIPGLFLVREKALDQIYVISVIEQEHINHYVVRRRNKNGERFFMICSHGFPDHDTVEEVIRFIMDMKERYDDLPPLKYVCESSTF